MNFGTKGTQELTGGGKYIRPGINHNVVIDSVKGVNESKPYIEFLFRTPKATAEEGNRQRFYMHTEGSLALNTARLKHIATKVVTESEIDNISANDIMDYGAKLNKLLSGKRLRMKFIAEEYVKADGSVGVRSVLPVQNFAEAINPGAEYPIVKDADTKLKYDENNTYDYKRLSEAPKSSETVTSSTSEDDDLPF